MADILDQGTAPERPQPEPLNPDAKLAQLNERVAPDTTPATEAPAAAPTAPTEPSAPSPTTTIGEAYGPLLAGLRQGGDQSNYERVAGLQIENPEFIRAQQGQKTPSSEELGVTAQEAARQATEPITTPPSGADVGITEKQATSAIDLTPQLEAAVKAQGGASVDALRAENPGLSDYELLQRMSGKQEKTTLISPSIPVVAGAENVLGTVISTLYDATIQTPIGLIELQADKFLKTGLAEAVHAELVSRYGEQGALVHMYEAPKIAAEKIDNALTTVALDPHNAGTFEQAVAVQTLLTKFGLSLVAPLAPGGLPLLSRAANAMKEGKAAQAAVATRAMLYESARAGGAVAQEALAAAKAATPEVKTGAVVDYLTARAAAKASDLTPSLVNQKAAQAYGALSKASGTFMEQMGARAPQVSSAASTVLSPIEKKLSKVLTQETPRDLMIATDRLDPESVLSGVISPSGHIFHDDGLTEGHGEILSKAGLGDHIGSPSQHEAMGENGLIRLWGQKGAEGAGNSFGVTVIGTPTAEQLQTLKTLQSVARSNFSDVYFEGINPKILNESIPVVSGQPGIAGRTIAEAKTQVTDAVKAAGLEATVYKNANRVDIFSKEGPLKFSGTKQEALDWLAGQPSTAVPSVGQAAEKSNLEKMIETGANQTKLPERAVSDTADMLAKKVPTGGDVSTSDKAAVKAAFASAGEKGFTPAEIRAAKEEARGPSAGLKFLGNVSAKEITNTIKETSGGRLTGIKALSDAIKNNDSGALAGVPDGVVSRFVEGFISRGLTKEAGLTEEQIQNISARAGLDIKAGTSAVEATEKAVANERLANEMTVSPELASRMIGPPTREGTLAGQARQLAQLGGETKAAPRTATVGTVGDLPAAVEHAVEASGAKPAEVSWVRSPESAPAVDTAVRLANRLPTELKGEVAARSLAQIAKDAVSGALEDAVNAVKSERGGVGPPAGGKEPPMGPYGPLPPARFSSVIQSYIINSLLSGAVVAKKASFDILTAVQTIADIITQPATSALLRDKNAASFADVPAALQMYLSGFGRGTEDFLTGFRSGRYGLEGDEIPTEMQRILGGENGSAQQVLAKIVDTATLKQLTPRTISAVTGLFGRPQHDKFAFYEGLRYAKERGLTGAAARKDAADFVHNLTPAQNKAAWEYASHQMLTNPVEGRLGDVLEAARNGGSGPAATIGNNLVFMAFPFTRFVSNLLAKGIEYTPYGFVTAFTKAQTAEEKAAVFNHAVLGSIGTVAMVNHAAAGNLTGDGPANASSRIALLNRGWKPNSIKLGDVWFENTLFGPLTPLLNAVGNYHDRMAYDTKVSADREDIGNKLAAGVMGIAGSVIDEEHYLGQFSDLVSAAQGDESDRQIQDTILGFADEFVPQIGNLKLAEGVAEARTPKVANSLPYKEQWKQLFMRQFPPALRDAVGVHIAENGGVRRPYAGISHITQAEGAPSQSAPDTNTTPVNLGW